MTQEELEANGIIATTYSLENSDIKVESRGGGAWAVVKAGSLCLNTDWEWEYEPLPSSRRQDFFERCRFDLSEALQKAVEARKKSP